MKDGEKKNTNTAQMSRADGYANALTGLGGPPDKSSYTFHQRFRQLQPEELVTMYQSDAMAARIVDRIVDDAIREGFTLTGKDEPYDFSSIMSEFEDYDVMRSISDAWRWARLYGGSIVSLALNDGRTLDQPLDMANIVNLIGLQINECMYVQPSGFDAGLGSRAFRSPDHYQILLPFGRQRAKKIHRSRVLRFDGLRIPPSQQLALGGWSLSVLQRVQTELFALGEVMANARTIMHDISIMVFSMKGLSEMVCGDANSQQELRRMMEAIRMTLDNLHVLALDSEDTYQEVKRDLSGIEKMIDQFISAIVRATDMPRTLLLGTQPGGLNASADSEIRAWYDFVHSQQELILTPVINRLLTILFSIRRRSGERTPSEWVITYNPLWQATAEDQAKTRLTNAQADQIYIMMGALKVPEVRLRLAGEGEIEIVKPEAEERPLPEAPVEPVKVFPAEDDLAQPSTEPVPPDLVSVREAAERVGVPTRTITRLCELGELPYWQFGQRKQVSMAEVAELGRQGPVVAEETPVGEDAET